MKKLLSLIGLLVLTTQLLAQNPDFDRKYQVAQDLFNKGQYEKARTAIKNTLKNLPSLSSAQIQKGNSLSAQCDQAIINRDRLDLLRESVELPFGSSQDSVGFVAAKPQLVKAVSSASWCEVKVVDNQVKVQAQMNPDKKMGRRAVVTVTMGKIKTRKFTVTQDARPETVKQVTIRTVPDRARLIVDGSLPITGIWVGKLDSGPHRIHIEKSGYFGRDTVINVMDDMRVDQDMNLELKLVPTFGKLKVSVLPQEGFSFNDLRPYDLIVNGRTVENDNYSYDDDRDIMRYSLYEDGTIPVPVGLVTVAATASSFEQERQDVQVKAGEVLPITLVLKAKYGRLNLIDAGQARNAVAYIDGKPVGAVQDITAYHLSMGDHSITLKKPGYVSVETAYPFTVHENEDVTINVSMTRYAPYVFDSAPADAKVSVDGVYIGNTPTKVFLLRETEAGKSFEVEIEKDGFLPVKSVLTPGYKDTLVTTMKVAMKPTRPLRVTTDEADLQLIVKNSRHGDSTFVDGMKLPADIAIPLRKKPYYVELHRVGKRYPAYRGKLRFDNEKKEKHHIQSWSASEFVPLAASMHLVGPGPMTVSHADLTPVDYKILGTVNLLRFRLFHGLSTSVVKGTAFMPTDPKASFAKSATSALNHVPTIANKVVLPAVTCLFLNGDLRMGGAIFDYMDVDFLTSYAWYPDFIKKAFGFSHVAGHDLFVGGEISSRLPYFNVSFRAGMQMYFNLVANLYDSGNTSTNTEQKYLSCPLTIPNMFVVGIEVSLGGKGNSIWRIF